MKTALVIGGGISGTTAAYYLAQKNWKVTLIEKEPFLGGGFKTFFYGGHPYTLGPRPLVSRNEEKTHVFEFVDSLVPLRKIPDKMLSFVERDGAFYSYPVHEEDIAKMPDAVQIRKELRNVHKRPLKEPKNFEEFWQQCLGSTLYDKFIDRYSRKMWQIKSNTQMKEFKWSPKGAALKKGPREVNCLMGYPSAYDGYEAYFKNCTRRVTVLLNAAPRKIDLKKRRVRVKDRWLQADIIVNSISLDDCMDHRFGELPYIGRDFMKMVLPVGQVFPKNVQYIYYPNDEEFLRVVEYKKLTHYRSPTTLLVMEIPSKNGKLYPLPFPKPKALAKKYMDALPKDVYTLGRLGTYTYNIDMEGIILQARELMEKL